MQSFFRLITAQPQILLDHAEAYTDLLGFEVMQASGAWIRCFIYAMLGIVLCGVTLALAGISLMLWATAPLEQIHSVWLLWVVPIASLCGALWCAIMARQYVRRDVFKYLRSQLKADMSLLRESRQTA